MLKNVVRRIALLPVVGWLALAAIAVTLAAPATQDLPETLPNGVSAGDATQTSAVLWARSTTPGFVTFIYGTEATLADPFDSLEAEVTDPDLPVKVLVEGLAPGMQYHYRVTDAAGNSLDGTFRTPAEPGTHNGLRFGVSGDWRGELSPYPAITNAAQQDLDFFVLHGDTIYADYPSPALDKPQAVTLEEFWAKHAEVYGTRQGLNAFAPLRAGTVIYAMIDDHEVTNDFAGGAPPDSDERFSAYEGQFINDTELYRNGLQAFYDYNPLAEDVYAVDDPLMDGKPRLYRYRTFGSDAAIFLVDARSFRSTPLPEVEDITDRNQVISFLTASLDDERTMLGRAQFEQLLADLLDAHEKGITWKFVFVPEPIQHFGTLYAQDRYEGYAAERAALLSFIVENDIQNVVFVSADFHGTIVNDVTYQGSLRDLLGETHHRTGTFEVVTGSVAFSEPFGPTVVNLALEAGFIDQEQYESYFTRTLDEQDEFVRVLINEQVEPLGYSPVGLQDAPDIDAELIQGKYLATNFFGWTAFEIDAETQALRVITYGIPAYNETDLQADPDDVLSHSPQVVSEFVVQPQ